MVLVMQDEGLEGDGDDDEEWVTDDGEGDAEEGPAGEEPAAAEQPQPGLPAEAAAGPADSAGLAAGDEAAAGHVS